MRILYLHQYFTTPLMPGITRSYEMARRFVDAGHEVNMITSAHHDDDQSKTDWFMTKEAGIKVHWLPLPYNNKMKYRERIKRFFQFALATGPKAIEIGGDVIFATSTPLTIAIPAIKAKKKLQIPMVFEVRDLWPDAPIQMGALKSPIAQSMARRLEKYAYRHSTHIIALTPGMREGIMRTGYPGDQITVAPNSSDLDLFDPRIVPFDLRKQYHFEDKFIILYFGTMGKANDLDYVIDSAIEISRREGSAHIQIVLLGDGSERERLIQRVRNEKINNVLFLEPVPKIEVPKIVAASDVCLTIFKNVPVLYTSSPNKMFDSFAAGKPVITNMPGWLQSLVEDHQVGVFVEPDNPKDFADKMMSLSGNPDQLKEFGINSRRLAEREFSRDKLATRILNVLESVGNAV